MPGAPEFHDVDPGTRRSMRSNRRVGTKPEIAVRREIHRRGMRYRIDEPIRTSIGAVRPDIVFPRQRVAIFIDGCFWHGCPLHATTPKRNREYWVPKLDRNRARDDEQVEALHSDGWSVLRFWEHQSTGRSRKP